MEVVGKVATIDGTLAITLLDDDSGNGILATTRSAIDLFGFCGSDRFILRLELHGDGFGFLSGMRMLGIRIDLQLLDHLVTKRAVGQHAPDSLFERVGGVLFHVLLESNPTLATDEAGVVEVLFHIGFGAGEQHFFRIDDHDEVASVNIGGKNGLVLAHEQTGHFAGDSTKRFLGGIDELPLAFDSLGVHHNGFHVDPLVIQTVQI
jgi:hypothetical protein